MYLDAIPKADVDKRDAATFSHHEMISKATSSRIEKNIQGTYERKYNIPAHAAASLAFEYKEATRNEKQIVETA